MITFGNMAALELEVRISNTIARFPKALLRVIRDQPWVSITGLALDSILSPVEAPLAKGIMATFKVKKIADGSELELQGPPSLLERGAIASERLARLGEPRGRPRIHGTRQESLGLAFEDVAESQSDTADAELAVREWVEQEKTLDPGEDDVNVVTERLLRILGIGPITAEERANPGRQDAARRLGKVIERFRIEQGIADDAVSSERIVEILQGVLSAWVEYAKAEIPKAIRDELIGMLAKP